MDWSGGRGRRCSTSLRRCARPARQIGSWCWRRGGRWVWALTGACWTPAPPTGKSGPPGPGRGGRRWHTVKRPAALCCLPSGGASSSASAPHARARDGGAPCGGSWPPSARWGRELLLVVCLTLLSTGAALAVPYTAGTGGGLLSALGRRGACRSVSAAAHSGRGRGGTVARQLGPTPLDGDPLPADGGPHPEGVLCQAGAAAPVLL